MAMVAETLGFALPGGRHHAGGFSAREALARESGRAVMRILEALGAVAPGSDHAQSLENACAVVGATGGSTNAMLHIPAIAHEAGVKFDIDDVAAVMKRVPLIADMKPGGRFLAKDMHAVGGVGVVLKELLRAGHLHGGTPHVAGGTLAEVVGAPAAAGRRGSSGSRRRARADGRTPGAERESLFRRCACSRSRV